MQPKGSLWINEFVRLLLKLVSVWLAEPAGVPNILHSRCHQWEQKENRMTHPLHHLKFQVPKNQKYDDTYTYANTNTNQNQVWEKHSPPLKLKT